MSSEMTCRCGCGATGPTEIGAMAVCKRPDIDELARLHEAATPGPFHINRFDNNDGSFSWQVQSSHQGDGLDDERFCTVMAQYDEHDHGPRAKVNAEAHRDLLNAAPWLLVQAREAGAEYGRAENRRVRLRLAITERDTLRARVEELESRLRAEHAKTVHLAAECIRAVCGLDAPTPAAELRRAVEVACRKIRGAAQRGATREGGEK